MASDGERPDDSATSAERLLRTPLKVINVGLAGFATDLAQAGVPVVTVDWRPPADGDPALAALLARLEG